MRVALAAGCFASASAWALLALAQGSAPPASPPAAAPAPASPPAASPPPAPSPPSVPDTAAPPSAPATPPTPAPAPAPSAPGAAAPPGPGDDAQQPRAAERPEPAPPPSETTPPAPASPPAAADKQPLEKAGTATAPASERAPVQPKQSDPWQDGHALALELSLRVSGRLNAASSNATYEERAGMGIDGALWFTLGSAYALGLGVKRADLGDISYAEGVNTIDAGYATTALELGLRAFPFRSENWDIFIGLRAGLAWQDVEATGLEQLGPMPDSAVPFQCSGVSGPGFALGAEIGAAFRLSPYLWLSGTVDANGYRLSSDMVDECIPGIGSITTLSVGLGLLYAFDLGAEAKL
jgi:hypothetical protein